MTRTILTTALFALLLPTSAGAASALECATAMDTASADLVPESLGYTIGHGGMAAVRDSLGPFTPFEGETMCLLSTGDPNSVEYQDYDWPGSGPDTSAGDRIEISFDLVVPAWANSLLVRHAFFSREYPKYVGGENTDTFKLNLAGAAWSGQAAFDAFGAPITVNNALFTVTAPDDLVGTGFDPDGSTGWLATVAPVLPGDQITLSITIYDVGDGLWDSAVLLDALEWHETPLTAPWTDHADGSGFPVTLPPDWPPEPEPLSLSFVSPNEAPLAGGTQVTVAGTGLAPGMEVSLGKAEAPVLELFSEWEARILVPSASDAGVPEGGSVDVRVVLDTVEAVLPSGFRYVAPEPEPEPELPVPHIDSVSPPLILVDVWNRVEITGTDLDGGAVEINPESGRIVDVELYSRDSGADGDTLTLMVRPTYPGLAMVRVHRIGGVATWERQLQFVSRSEANDSGCGAGGGGTPSLSVLLLGSLLMGRRRRAGRRHADQVV